MSILGGQKMVPQDACRMFDKPVFHDTTLAFQRMSALRFTNIFFCVFFHGSFSVITSNQILNLNSLHKYNDTG